MAEDKNTGNDREEIRDDLRQKDEGGKDSTRIGSTYSDVLATEWKPGDMEHHRSEDPEAGRPQDTGISTGNGSSNMGE